VCTAEVAGGKLSLRASGSVPAEPPADAADVDDDVAVISCVTHKARWVRSFAARSNQFDSSASTLTTRIDFTALLTGSILPQCLRRPAPYWPHILLIEQRVPPRAALGTMSVIILFVSSCP
jgi:hypothetical protein